VYGLFVFELFEHELIIITDYSSVNCIFEKYPPFDIPKMNKISQINIYRKTQKKRREQISPFPTLSHYLE